MSRNEAAAIDSKDKSSSEFQDATFDTNDPDVDIKLEALSNQESCSKTEPAPIRSFDNATWFSKLLFLWPFSYIQLCGRTDVTESNLPSLRYVLFWLIVVVASNFAPPPTLVVFNEPTIRLSSSPYFPCGSSFYPFFG